MPSLDWIGKSDVENYLEHIPTYLLRCDRELSHGDPAFDLSPGTGNLLIEGDNLLALKALLPYYGGQVKCIYIDPPYNTGNEQWMYNDNVNSPQMQKWLGKVVDGEDLCRHDKWLCMMQARLHIHHDLLRENGAIFISIDDNEVHHLRMLCDQIFGAQNFVAQIVWQKRYSRENREVIGDAHEYILIYAKDMQVWRERRPRLPLTEQQAKIYKNPNGIAGGRWRGIPMTAQGYRPNQMYEIVTPVGVVHKPPKGRCWSMVRSEYEKLLAADRIYFGKDDKAQPSVIRYLSEVEGIVPWTWWPHEEGGHTDEAKKEIHAILGKEDAFATPKPTRLIERILQIATDPGDIVLDSFAGSGTTGHAVLKMNAQNPDQPPRRFVLVEMEADIARPITRERLKRAIDGYGKHEALGGGFRFCHLGEKLLDGEGGLNPDAAWRDLAHFLYMERFGSALETSRLDQASGFIGRAGNTSLFLLFRDNAIAPLDSRALKELAKISGPKIVYCDCIGVPSPLLERAQIQAYQAPYEVTR